MLSSGIIVFPFGLFLWLRGQHRRFRACARTLRRPRNHVRFAAQIMAEFDDLRPGRVGRARKAVGLPARSLRAYLRRAKIGHNWA